MDEFESFWSLYPRKVAKTPAKKIWARMLASERFAALKALPKHLEVWRAEGRELHFTPYPNTWLSQKRWEDETNVPTLAEPTVAWWTTADGIQKKAREIGLSPKPGEEWPAFKRRVIDAVKKAA